MAKLGPKYTGNKAHTDFVEFLATEFQKAGLELTRDHFKFTRWDAKRCGIKVTPSSGKSFEVPYTSYYPYSGQTPSSGVTGELVYGGTSAEIKLPDNVQGKIVFLESPVKPMPYSEWYSVLGAYEKDTPLPESNMGAINQLLAAPLLAPFKKAGAAGVIIAWTNVSDENAAYQYTPFSRPLQEMPTLWVGRSQAAKLRSLAVTGAKCTLTLEADLVPDTPTDALVATLPGSSSDEVLIVNTHTDGPNATEENGALGCLALAKYFAKLPKSERKRTCVFVLATGHFCLPYVQSIAGFIKNHPDIIKKTVGALTIEHLGAREWKDDAKGVYRATGKDELSLVITNHQSTADAMTGGAEGTMDRRLLAVKPKTGPFFGEGGALSRAGIPTIGYIPLPDYLLAGPPDCYIGKLSPTLLNGQIQALAKVVHRMDVMPADQLKS
ncbi:MAG TPA: hypothetical protein VKG25_03690 [Bryobacteraceae bacterium]|nr:hypothetical protein [Bryobacteraceae bacterium]